MVNRGLEVTASILRQEFLTSALAAVQVLADAAMIRAGEPNREREKVGVAGADLRERGQRVGRRLVRKLMQKKKGNGTRLAHDGYLQYLEEKTCLWEQEPVSNVSCSWCQQG